MDYKEFFGLNDAPFRMTPDPSYYYNSANHEEALQTLVYSIQAREGFAQITGEPGTGKTLTLRNLMTRLGENVTPVILHTPRLSPEEVLRVILENLGMSADKMEGKTKDRLLRVFRAYLMKKAREGVTTVVIVDEAQDLPLESMEELRLLTNLETEKDKLLQIILLGQLQLEEKLAGPELTQLHQRITVRYRLNPLSREDTIAYVTHRIRRAGGNNKVVFTDRFLKRLHKVTGGYPRTINSICERSLMAAFVDGQTTVDLDHLNQAIKSVAGEELSVKQTKTQGQANGSDFWSKPNLVMFILLVLISSMFISLLGTMAYHYFFTSRAPAPVERSAPPTETAGRSSPQPAGEPAAPPAAPAKPKPVAAAPTEKSTPAMPPSPAEAFLVAPGKLFIEVDAQDLKASLWQGNKPAPTLRTQMTWPEPLPDGLFLLGQDLENNRFFVQYPSVGKKGPAVPSADFMADISVIQPFPDIVPVLVHHSGADGADKKAEYAAELRKVIDRWAEALRKKEVDRFVAFYGKDVTTYFVGVEKPVVYPHEQLRLLQKDEFLRSGQIKLTISDLVCLAHPDDPAMVMAVFRQDYESDILSDRGIRAFYFRYSENGEGEDWKIQARLWVPRPKTTPAD